MIYIMKLDLTQKMTLNCYFIFSIKFPTTFTHIQLTLK